jgi:hypothetical protein
MTKKFEQNRKLVAALTAAAERSTRLKAKTEISSNDDVCAQVAAVKDLIRRSKLQKLVTVKVGLWFKRMPMVDVVINWDGEAKAKNGQEAFELSSLMTEAHRQFTIILGHGLPKIRTYAPTHGLVEGAWRFQ